MSTWWLHQVGGEGYNHLDDVEEELLDVGDVGVDGDLLLGGEGRDERGGGRRVRGGVRCQDDGRSESRRCGRGRGDGRRGGAA